MGIRSLLKTKDRAETKKNEKGGGGGITTEPSYPKNPVKKEGWDGRAMEKRKKGPSLLESQRSAAAWYCLGFFVRGSLRNH